MAHWVAEQISDGSLHPGAVIIWAEISHELDHPAASRQFLSRRSAAEAGA